MNKLVSIIIYSILIILFFLFCSYLFKSCGNKASNAVAETTDMVEENIEAVGEKIVATTSTEEEFEGDEIDYSEDNTESTYEAKSSGSSFELTEEEKKEPVYQYEEEDDDEEITPTKSEPPSTQKKSTPTVSNSGGNFGSHMIIAGNYTELSNADKMVQKAKDLGYSSARHVRFDNSRYYTLIAGYYDSFDEATKASSSLSNNGIDSYVKRRS